MIFLKNILKLGGYFVRFFLNFLFIFFILFIFIIIISSFGSINLLENFHLFWYPKFHYGAENIEPLDAFLNQFNPLYMLA